MDMKKKWEAAAALLIAVCVAGCTPTAGNTQSAQGGAAAGNATTAKASAAATAAGSKTTAAASGNTAASGPATVTVMQQNDDAHKYFQTLGDEFKKANPNITVSYVGVPYDDFDAKLQTMLASHTQPDITTHAQLMGYMDYYAKGLLTDLTPYIQKYGWTAAQNGIPDSAMAMATIDGKVYGIPLNIFTTVMLYNKDLFDAAKIPYPPSDYGDTAWTFDKMLADAKQLTSGSGANATYGLYWSWNGGGAMQDPDYFNAALFPPGAVSEGYATDNNLDQPDVINAYQKLSDMVKQGISPSQAYVDALGGNDPFYTGKIAMEVEGAWGLAGLNDLPFKAGVAAVPIGGNPKVRAVTYIDPYFIMTGSVHPDEAFQFLAYMAQPDNQIKMVQDSGGNPPASSQALDTYYKFFNSIDPADLKKAVEGSYQYSVEDLEHLIVGSGQIHDLLYNELSPVMDAAKTAQDVCPPLKPQLNELLAQIKAGNAS